jgi:hypothetical protein
LAFHFSSVGIGIANLRDAPDEWSLQFAGLGLAYT